MTEDNSNKVVGTIVMAAVFAMGGLLGVAVERATRPKPAEVIPSPTMADLMDKISVVQHNAPVRFIMSPEGEIHILGNPCPDPSSHPISGSDMDRIGRELQRACQRVIDRNEAIDQPQFSRDSQTYSSVDCNDNPASQAVCREH